MKSCLDHGQNGIVFQTIIENSIYGLEGWKTKSIMGHMIGTSKGGVLMVF